MKTDLEKIINEYDKIGGKKLFKNTVKELNSNKKVFVFYSKRKNIPISAFPKLKTIVSSKVSFISFCYNFYDFYKDNLEISSENIKLIAKFVIAHEMGHILDLQIKNTSQEFSNIFYELVERTLKYNFSVTKSTKNIPYELEVLSLNLKKNLIKREVDAWSIAKELIDFNNEFEILLFNKIKEYALATYNHIDYKTIFNQYNLDYFVKIKKQFA